ncbi:MAG: biotin/lipoyl-binding protein, partial [Mesorhizobium sp.]
MPCEQFPEKRSAAFHPELGRTNTSIERHAGGYEFSSCRTEWTDDAFIDARTVTVGAEIAGRITEVAVTDNQSVEAGAVLLRIDDSDYQASLKQAEAGVAAAQAEITNVEAQTEAQNAKIDAAHKQVAQALAALEFAKSEDQRNRELLARGTATQQQAQQA